MTTASKTPKKEKNVWGEIKEEGAEINLRFKTAWNLNEQPTLENIHPNDEKCPKCKRKICICFMVKIEDDEDDEDEDEDNNAHENCADCGNCIDCNECTC